MKYVFNNNRDKNQISCVCIPIRQLKNVHKLTLSVTDWVLKTGIGLQITRQGGIQKLREQVEVVSGYLLEVRFWLLSA